MAIQSTAIWEVRPSGDANNGAGWDSGISGAGTDYSQQDAAQLTLTDGACLTASTTLTSATGGFTSAMVGNALYISSGTNALTAHFFITGYTDTNTVTIDRTCASGGDASSINFKVGGGKSRITDQMCEDAVAGNTIYVKSGSITQSESITISSTSSTWASPIVLEGYDTTRGDQPKNSNRPVIDAGANSLTFYDYWKLKFLDITGTASNLVSKNTSGNYSQLIHCKVTNTSVSASRNAVTGRSWAASFSEFISTNGVAFAGNVFPMGLNHCYIHDSVTGLNGVSNADAYCFFCVFDTLTTGISADNLYLHHNIFYNCSTDGIKCNDNAEYNAITHNMFVSCGDGIDFTNTNGTALIEYNLYWNNTTDVRGVSKGDNAVESNPDFTDAANGDFTVGSSSPAIDAGFDMSELGITGSYKINIGVDQDDNSSGGGGGQSSYTFIF